MTSVNARRALRPCYGHPIADRPGGVRRAQVSTRGLAATDGSPSERRPALPGRGAPDDPDAGHDGGPAGAPEVAHRGQGEAAAHERARHGSANGSTAGLVQTAVRFRACRPYPPPEPRAKAAP